MSKQYGQSIPVGVDLDSNVDAFRAWFAGYVKPDMPWLLIHADDGVIWGKRALDGKLLLSSDVFKDPVAHPAVAVKLRAPTLQEARIFGPAGELRLWRTAEGFKARLLTDDGVGLDALPEERHLLWHQGSPPAVSEEKGFALLQEGARGQRHAPPVIPQGAQRPKLLVRHYLDYDPEGQAFIALSRLVGVEE